VDLETWCLWFKRRGAGRLRRVLKLTWDPIGIHGVAYARDEYDGYLPPIAERLRSGADANGIADVLGHIQDDRMGLPGSRPRLLSVAERILAWYDAERPPLLILCDPAARLTATTGQADGRPPSRGVPANRVVSAETGRPVSASCGPSRCTGGAGRYDPIVLPPVATPRPGAASGRVT
jgi:hypothetical protein